MRQIAFKLDLSVGLGSSVLVIPLDEVNENNFNRVGGKAANLGLLISAGFAVPPGFVVPVEA